MVVFLILLTGAVAVLMFAKVTKWYELLMLGGWGILVGAALSGTSRFDGLSLTSLWNVIF